MRLLTRYILLFFLCTLPVISHAQEKPKDKAPATTRAQKKAAKKKWKAQRRLEMQQKKAVKAHHKRIQTKETRKTMRRERRKSDKLRSNKREFFLVRWFRFRR